MSPSARNLHVRSPLPRLLGRTSVGPLLMIGSAAFWALGTVFSKAVLSASDPVSPVPLLAIQLMASVTFLTPVILRRLGQVGPALRRGWTGLLEPGAAYFLGMLGLALVSASLATVIGSLEPVVIPFIAWLLIRRHPRPSQLLVAGIATAGAIAASWDDSTQANSVLGIALLVAGVVAAATYVVLSASHVIDVKPGILAWSQQMWSLALIVPTCIGVTILLPDQDWPGEPVTWLAAAASGVCSYAIPFVLYLMALTRIPLHTAAIYLCLIPVFGVMFAVMILGEDLSVIQVVGALIVVVALALAALLPSQRGESEHDKNARLTGVERAS